MTQQNCPDCDALLNPQKERCSCGWGSNGKLPKWLKEQCSYTHNGQRCPQRGHIGLDTRGLRWYCRAHFHAQYDDKESQTILRDYLAQHTDNKAGGQP